MKHLPSLLIAPPGLREWVAQHPEDAESIGSEASAVWKRFKDSPAYHELLLALVARQQGLCGYCEQRLTTPQGGELVHADYQVEHVKPKSGGAGQTLAWENLMLCCGGGCWPHHPDSTRFLRGAQNRPELSCGQTKEDDDLPKSCDPRAWPWQQPLVEINLEGSMQPIRAACESAGVDVQVLDRTLNEVLRLNNERLRRARQTVAANLTKWVVEILEELLNNAPNLSSADRSELVQTVAGGRLGPDRHGHLLQFWSTERQYLPDAETWIAQNSATLNF